MARKYGIVAASDVKIAPVRGANMHTGNIHMPRKPYQPVMSHSPGMVRPGAGVGGAIARGAAGVVAQTGRVIRQQRQQKTEQARAATMPLHPSAAPQSAVASATGGNPPGAVRASPGVIQPPPAAAYFKAPTGGMGAKVPASRAAKFAQGRGTP